MKYTTIINEVVFEIEVSGDGKLLVNGKEYQVDFLPLANTLYSFIKDNQSHEMAIEVKDGNKYEVLLGGRLYEGQVLDERSMLMVNRRGGIKLDSGEIHAPMPGLIVAVQVAVGDSVEAGDTVVVLESMKMQNELKATKSGVVESVQVGAGQTVDKGNLLINIVDADET
jgi:biotin carboxyl carrier protein